MNKIAFAFDLHNTILRSNEAWIEAYVENSSESYREYVVQAVYRKTARKAIADAIFADYNSVYTSYRKKVSPDKNVLSFLQHLKKFYPIYLISAASKQKVYNDLEGWNGESYFDVILTKENFHKSNVVDWEQLIYRYKLEILIYIGNDIEEDIIISDKVIPLICGNFLERLNFLGLLINWEEDKI